MLIKEYRIPLPLRVEEYRIAQLYMIQKKSREESEGEGSAVEILQNHPYSDENGSGQYTYKIYHIGRHLPNWFRNIAPKTALEVHEESWNAYPYTKTKFSVPFVDKFSLEVITYFEQDGGTQENRFNLKPAELRQRELDVIDMVNDTLSGNDYKKEEDPRIYVSQKTGRGPLSEDWISNPPGGIIMCSYKLIKVEFRYWGLQSKIERFIHDYGLRRVMLRAHRQAWAWQDEWVGLTIADIRRLEKETQLILQRKLGRVVEDDDIIDEDENKEAESSESVTTEGSTSPAPKPSAVTSGPVAGHQTTSQPKDITTSRKKSLQGQGSFEGSTLWERKRNSWRVSRGEVGGASRKSSLGGVRSGDSSHSNPLLRVGSTTSNDSTHSTRPEWALDTIAMESGSESDQEFFDAKTTLSDDEQSGDEDEEISSLSSRPHPPFPIPNSLPLADPHDSSNDNGGMKRGKLFNMAGSRTSSIDYQSGDEIATPLIADLSLATAARTPTSPDILFLVIHGGSSLDPRKDRVGKTIDFENMQRNIREVTNLHFHSAMGRIATRLVPCPNICTPAIELLCQVNPTPVSKEEYCDGLLPKYAPGYNNKDTPPGSDEPRPDIPIGALPLLATEHHSYLDMLTRVCVTANSIYRDFLKSDEGAGFSGQVCILSDCMGSIVAYDILTSGQMLPHSHPPTPSPPPTITHSQSLTRQRRVSHAMYEGQRSKYRHSTSINSALERKQNDPPVPPASTGTPRKHPSVHSLTSDLSTSSTSINVTDCEGDSLAFSFDVSHFFALGSPLGLVLASRRAKSRKSCKDASPRPNCASFYNLFYSVDVLASRVEPVLDGRFTSIPPVTVPLYKLYPTGVAKGNSLKETVVKHPYLFESRGLLVPSSVAMETTNLTRKKSVSSECLSLKDELTREEIKPFSVWWSKDRIDYALEAPRGSEAFELLPPSTFSYIVHSRYWEAKEMVSFMLRQVLQHVSVCVEQSSDGRSIVPFLPRDNVIRWNRKRTSMKIQHLSSNHRAHDAVTMETGTPPTIMAKFQYGPLAMVSLKKETVDVYLHLQAPKPEWQLIGSSETDNHGKVVFSLPKELNLALGHYPIKFLVKGDHTTASCNLFIVPPHTEAVVFSIDGSLASNFTISARDMKMKHSAVEVVRKWQERGYFIIYISGRPDMQKEHVLSFLGAHGFPLGLVAVADSISTDTKSLKTLYLARLIKEAKVILRSAYGSNRHLSGYKELGLQPDQIFILGRRFNKKSSEEYTLLSEGFPSHLVSLMDTPPRQAAFDVRQLTGDSCFALPGNPVTSRYTNQQRRLLSNKRSAFKNQRSKSRSVDSNGERQTTHRVRTNSIGPTVETTV